MGKFWGLFLTIFFTVPMWAILDYDKQVPIIQAVTNDDTTKILECLEKGVNLHEGDGWGLTALHVAVSLEKVPMVQFLLYLGSDPSYNSKISGITPFDIAVGRNHKKILALFWEHPKVIYNNKLLLNSLENAIVYEHLDLIDLLLSKGININDTLNSRVIGAVYYKKTNLLDPLLDRGAIPNEISFDNFLIAHNFEMIERFFDPSYVQGYKGATILYSIADSYYYYGDEEETKFLQLFLKNGADPKILISSLHDYYKETTFMNLTYNGRLEAMKIVLEYGIDINQRNDHREETALFYAIRSHISEKRQYKILEFLLENNADPTLKNSKGQNAQEYNKQSVIKLLRNYE